MISMEEIEAIIKSILTRGSKKYTTNSGAFLDILGDFAAKKRIEDIADANSIYVDVYPIVGNFIAAMLPGILVTHYFAILEDFPFDTFIKWSISEPNWANTIKENYKNKQGLIASIKNISDRVSEFKEITK